MNGGRGKGRSGRGELIGYGLERFDDADGHVEYLVDDAAGGAIGGLKLGVVGVFLLKQLFKRLFGLVLLIYKMQEINPQLLFQRAAALVKCGTELRLYSSLSSRLKAYAIRLERVLPLQRCALSDAK